MVSLLVQFFYSSRIQTSGQLRSRSVIGIELEHLMSGDFTDDLEWGSRPDDSGNQWVLRMRDSVVGVVLTGWSPLQQKLGALLQVGLFKVEELEDRSYRHAVTLPPPDRRRGRVPVTRLTKTLAPTSLCWQM